jgi:hypothetical protein
MTRKRLFAIVLTAGAAIVIGCWVGGFTQFAGALTSGAPQHVPGRFHVSLGSGQWEIYQLTGTTTSASVGAFSASVTNQQAASLTATMVTVTTASGSQLPVRNQSAGATETLRRGSDDYTGVATFRAASAGEFSVSVDSPDAGSIVVARPILSVFLALLPWIGGGLLGGACLVVGLIGVIVAHRRNPARSAAGPRPWPAGGDPGLPGP